MLSASGVVAFVSVRRLQPGVIDFVTLAVRLCGRNHASQSQSASASPPYPSHAVVPGGTYKYSGTPNVWSQIGSDPAEALFPAAGTVFIRSASNTLRYLGTPGQWANLGTGIGKITGTTTAAYAVIGGNIVRLDPGNVRTTVRNAGDARDIAAGGAHLFTLTTVGSVLRLEDSGAWMDVSCAGPLSTAGCANGCEPGPSPSGTVPSYSDVQKHTQDNPANAQYNVLTYHNDNARTGAATHENILTPSAVVNGDFGYLGSVTVKGKIYGQPLYMEQGAVNCTGAGRPTNANIAFVATLENIVYAIDVNQRTVCWQTPALGCPQRARAPGCWTAAEDDPGDSSCNVNFDMGDQGGVRLGIVATPVIDRTRDLIYVVARVRDGSDVRGRFFLNVIDTRTGQLVSKAEAVADTLNGHDDCGGHAFRPSVVTNRTALLLVNDKVFLAFAANKGETDKADYHGHVIGFDVSNPAHPQRVLRSFCATPNGAGGGIWMAGGGPASDGTSVYLTTGNGAQRWVNGKMDKESIPNAPPAQNYPDSFVKLAMNLTATGYTDTRTVPQMYPLGIPFYAPRLPDGKSIFWGREGSDADFGSGGVLLLGNRLISGGKDGRVYVIDKATMTNVQDFQAFVHNYDELGTYRFASETDWNNGPHIHGGLVAWDPRPNVLAAGNMYVYGWSEKDHLKRFRFNALTNLFVSGDAVNATPVFPSAHGDLASSAPDAMPGGMLSISSNGAQNGIVWAVIQEPYKFCTRTGAAIQVDRPEFTGTEVPGCDVQGGYVPGRLFAFDATADSSNRLRLLWGDTNRFAPNNFISAYAKHTPPTVAHGKILVATANSELRFYGLGSTQRQRRPIPVNGITLAGAPGFITIPLAASNGNGSFTVTNAPTPNFPIWAIDSRVRKLVGDFNGDGRADLALIGGWTNGSTPWHTIPLAFSNGEVGGTFRVTNEDVGAFGGWATAAAAKLVGDFNGDGRTDIVLLEGSPDEWWWTIPLAFSNGNGTFRITNYGSPPNHIRCARPPISQGDHDDCFEKWAKSALAAKLVGDFDGDGRSDIALTGALERRWLVPYPEYPFAYLRGLQLPSLGFPAGRGEARW